MACILTGNQPGHKHETKLIKKGSFQETSATPTDLLSGASKYYSWRYSEIRSILWPSSKATHDLQIRRVLYHPEVNTRCDTAELGQVPSPNERPGCLVSDCTLGHFSPALSSLRKEKPTHISYVCLSMSSFC